MSKSQPFVHLHLHTEYSLLDGLARIGDVVSRAAALDMPAIAITDHGAMYGVVDFYKACREQGIQPIVGCEVYVAPRSRHDRTPKVDDDLSHLVLLAENRAGYKNLIKLVSLGFTEGFYYKPRVDRELLERHHEGLIALSACLAGEVPRAVLRGDPARAEETARWYRDVFGKDHFYLELQDNGIDEQAEVNEKLLEMSSKIGVPVIATNDCHYVKREDSRAHDVLLCIQTQSSVDDEKRLRFQTDQFYIKSPEEMWRAFGEVPEALYNTVSVMQRCKVDFEFGKPHLPRYPIPKGYDAASYLRKICQEKLPARYGANPPSRVLERLDYELAMIEKMGYPGYFLVVWDFVEHARSRGIPVGPGRGSAAGSLVAYVLGITDIDPLVNGLLFERFLNPERVTLPDMDIDFCFERRGEVIDYVIARYGKESVAQIITFGTMAARAAIRDVGRALGFSYSEVDRIAKLVPFQIGVTLDKALETEQELRALYAEDERIRTMIDLARRVEGLPRHASVHAAGVVISRDPLVEHVPLQRMQDGAVVTQFPMGTLEELGLLKMDFLGLRTLTVIQKTLELISRARGKELKAEDIPLDDKLTYDRLGKGDAIGVFQLESGWVRDFLKELEPKCFEDLVATVALCRPGPMEHIPEYLKNRREGARYPHPMLEPYLKDTYGIMIYQEQIMQVAAAVAGFSLGQADLLRRAVSKKKREILDEQRDSFVKGCIEHGLDEDSANSIYDLIMKFANYGFNKSHAAAYALVAYRTAYLKANFPTEFMAALLTSVQGNADKVAAYVEESRRMGIKVLPPDVNESAADFTVTGGAIRFGLSAVKNVGKGAMDSIIRAREEGGAFKTISEFCERLDLRVVNKRAIESLIKCGAFDTLGRTRKQLLEGLDVIVDRAQKARKSKGLRQALFEFSLECEEDLPDVGEFSKDELLKMEKSLLGLYVTSHPLADLPEKTRALATASVGRLREMDGSNVTLVGMVTGQKRIVTKGGEAMAFVTFEDSTGSVEVVFFPRVYAEARELIESDSILVLDGAVSVQEDEAKVTASSVSDASGRGRARPKRKRKPREAGEIAAASELDPGESLEEGQLWRIPPEYISMFSDPGAPRRPEEDAPVEPEAGSKEVPGGSGVGTRRADDVRVWVSIKGEISSRPGFDGVLSELRDACLASSGESPLYIQVPDAGATVLAAPRYWVAPSGELVAKLDAIAGEGSTRIDRG